MADAQKDLIARLIVHGPDDCGCFPACIARALGVRGEHDEAKRHGKGKCKCWPNCPPGIEWDDDTRREGWERWPCAADLYYCGDPSCNGSWAPHELAEISADNGGRP